MSDNKYKDIIKKCLEMRERSYCPYSDYAVGAAVLMSDGTIFTGCNIENAAFAPTICAERTAIFKAISEGRYDFAAIAVAGGKKGETPADYFWPCGTCRQVMREFFTADTPVITVKNENDFELHKLEEMLPFSFGKEKMQE